MAETLDRAARRLERAGVPDPRREAEFLLAWILGTDRGGVVARRPDPLPPATLRRIEEGLARRAAREPLQYVTGEQEFRGLALAVDSRVLVPRPETEHVVEAVLGCGLSQGARVADLGTGSGCIAVALAVERPDLEIVAVDRSAGALEVARANAARHGAADRIDFAALDFAALPPDWTARFDAVASNPPYVSEEEWRSLAPEVRDHEPREALVPGPSGEEAYAVLGPVTRRLLRAGGFLAVELGFRSEAAARAIFEKAGFEAVVVAPDLRGIPRVLTARRGGAP